MIKIKVKDLPVFKVTKEEADILRLVKKNQPPDFLCNMIKRQGRQSWVPSKSLLTKIGEAIQWEGCLEVYLDEHKGYGGHADAGDHNEGVLRLKWIDKILRYNKEPLE